MKRTYRRRKVAPRVTDGAVQKKHRHQPTAALGYVIDRHPPGKGFRHVLSKRDIRDFTTIIPNWHDVAVGLESIILTRFAPDHEGLYQVYNRERTGSIHIPAWDADLWRVLTTEYFEEHREILERLGVAFTRDQDGVECRFTAEQARGFLLLHVFLHELGHHVDRMQSKKQADSPRGEPFAEQYANELSAALWTDYLSVFGDPRVER